MLLRATIRRCLLALAPLVLMIALPSSSIAQYTDSQAIADHGGLQAFAARRAQLAKTLASGYILLFARNEIPEATHYREDNDFYYFTGLQDPGAVLFFDIKAGAATLFEPAQSPRTAQVYGPNFLSLPADAQQPFGFAAPSPGHRSGRFPLQLSTIRSRFESMDSSRLPGQSRWRSPRSRPGSRAEIRASVSTRRCPTIWFRAKELADRYPMVHHQRSDACH